MENILVYYAPASQPAIGKVKPAGGGISSKRGLFYTFIDDDKYYYYHKCLISVLSYERAQAPAGVRTTTIVN